MPPAPPPARRDRTEANHAARECHPGSGREGFGLTARLLALATLLLVSAATDADAAEQPSAADLPAALRDAITRLQPAAAVLGADEILVERCGAERRRDQVARADFNGDGRADYAVLLRIGEPKAVAGEALKSAPVWAVVFLARRDGLYRPFILSKSEEVMIPSRQVIALQSPGRVHHGAHPERVLTLKQPGIALILCGGTEKVYYWVNRGQTFREYLTRE